MFADLSELSPRRKEERHPCSRSACGTSVPEPEGNPLPMSTLALLVVLLLALIGGIIFGGLVYLAHRHPSCCEPLLVGLTGVAVLVALVTPIVTR